MLVPVIVLSIPAILIVYVLAASFFPQSLWVRIVGNIGAILFEMWHLILLVVIAAFLGLWAYHTYYIS